MHEKKANHDRALISHLIFAAGRVLICGTAKYRHYWNNCLRNDTEKKVNCHCAHILHRKDFEKVIQLIILRITNSRNAKNVSSPDALLKIL